MATLLLILTLCVSLFVVMARDMKKGHSKTDESDGTPAPISIVDRLEYSSIILFKESTKAMFRDQDKISYHSFTIEIDVTSALNISLFHSIEGERSGINERLAIIDHELQLLHSALVERCGELEVDDTADQPQRREKRFIPVVSSLVGGVLYTFAFPVLLTIWSTVQQLQIFAIKDELERQKVESEAAQYEYNEELSKLTLTFSEATKRLYMNAYRGVARAERKLQLQAIERVLTAGKIGHGLFPAEQLLITLKSLYSASEYNSTPYASHINLFYDLAKVLNAKFNRKSGRLRLQIYLPIFVGGAEQLMEDVFSIIHRGEISLDRRKFVYFELPTQVLAATNIFDCPLLKQGAVLPDQLASYPLRVIDTYRHFVYQRKWKGHTLTATTLTMFMNTTVPDSGVLVSMESAPGKPVQIYQMHDPILFQNYDSDVFTRLLESQLQLIREQRKDNSVVFTFREGAHNGVLQSKAMLMGLMVMAIVMLVLILAIAACCFCGISNCCVEIRKFVGCCLAPLRRRRECKKDKENSQKRKHSVSGAGASCQRQRSTSMSSLCSSSKSRIVRLESDNTGMGGAFIAFPYPAAAESLTRPPRATPPKRRRRNSRDAHRHIVRG